MLAYILIYLVVGIFVCLLAMWLERELNGYLEAIQLFFIPLMVIGWPYWFFLISKEFILRLYFWIEDSKSLEKLLDKKIFIKKRKK